MKPVPVSYETDWHTKFSAVQDSFDWCMTRQ